TCSPRPFFICFCGTSCDRAGAFASTRRMKGIAILGSTGSIGQSALSVVSSHPDRLRVVTLAAGGNAALLAEQVARFQPAAVAVATDAALDELKTRVRGLPPVEMLPIGR